MIEMTSVLYQNARIFLRNQIFLNRPFNFTIDLMNDTRKLVFDEG